MTKRTAKYYVYNCSMCNVSISRTQHDNCNEHCEECIAGMEAVDADDATEDTLIEKARMDFYETVEELREVVNANAGDDSDISFVEDAITQVKDLTNKICDS